MHTIAEPIAQTPEGERATPIAIVGLACRFPDADDPLTLFESALAGRRSFRRLPPGRLGLAAADGQPPRAALLEGWQFSRAEFGVAETAYRAADPAHWLALETAGRALADAGFPGGQGLAGDRAGVLLGNTLTGEVSRAAALRTQWPFVATVLEAALAAGAVPPAGRPGVLRHAAGAFAAPFPEPGPATLAGSQPGAIADRICRHFRFRGGGQAVDAAHSSALLAVATGCALLAAGELDFVLAGGVDISLDPFELGGLAQAGLLTAGPMRIYDTSPTGFLPGEGCGIIALMRAADARAADMPSYADIVGWGTSSAGLPSNQLLALQRAYQRAAVAPGDVQFIEGDGRGTADADLAELTALSTIRAGAAAAAALGSVKANIGHTKAAAGAAGLIKAALAVNAGVIPPVTGCVHPHPVLRDSGAVLRVPRSAESWPGRTRLAAVSSIDPAGCTVHLVLRRERHQLPGPAQPPSAAPPPSPAGQLSPPEQSGGGQPGSGPPAAAGPKGRTLAAWSVPSAPRAEAFTFSGPDRATLATLLSQVAAAAPGLSDAELSDLACQSGREAHPGPVRVALVATDQDELCRLQPGRGGPAAQPAHRAADHAARPVRRGPRSRPRRAALPRRGRGQRRGPAAARPGRRARDRTIFIERHQLAGPPRPARGRRGGPGRGRDHRAGLGGQPGRGRGGTADRRADRRAGQGGQPGGPVRGAPRGAGGHRVRRPGPAAHLGGDRPGDNTGRGHPAAALRRDHRAGAAGRGAARRGGRGGPAAGHRPGAGDGRPGGRQRPGARGQPRGRPGQPDGPGGCRHPVRRGGRDQPRPLAGWPAVTSDRHPPAPGLHHQPMCRGDQRGSCRRLNECSRN